MVFHGKSWFQMLTQYDLRRFSSGTRVNGHVPSRGMHDVYLLTLNVHALPTRRCTLLCRPLAEWTGVSKSRAGHWKGNTPEVVLPTSL